MTGSNPLTFKTKNGETAANILFNPSIDYVYIQLVFGSDIIASRTINRTRSFYQRFIDERRSDSNSKMTEEDWFKKHISDTLSNFTGKAKLRVAEKELQSERELLKRKTENEQYQQIIQIVIEVTQDYYGEKSAENS